MDRTRQNDIIRHAEATADKAPLVADDFAQALFPRSEALFNDRMLSNARQYLNRITNQIERCICQIATEELGVAHEILLSIARGGEGKSFSLLKDSGLFGTDEIIQHLFVKTQQGELAARLLQKISQEDLESTLTCHLDHEDAQVAEAAMALLVAQSRTTGVAGEVAASLADLPAEIAYAFAWPVTAALSRLIDSSGAQLQKATERLLGSHDESSAVARKAERLAQLLEQSGTDEDRVPHPMIDGLPLFIARLARQSGLTGNQIIAFTAEPEMVRLVVAMRAADYPVQDALSVFAALGDSGQVLTAATYRETDQDRAKALVSRWATPAIFQNAERILSRDTRIDRVK